MGGRRHGEELPPKITDCIEDEMGGRRGGKWGEGDGYLLLGKTQKVVAPTCSKMFVLSGCSGFPRSERLTAAKIYGDLAKNCGDTP